MKRNKPTHESTKSRIDHMYSNYRKITDVVSSDISKFGRCFILGGDESLSGFNYSILDNNITIGINRSFESYNSTLLYSMDTRLYNWITLGKLDEYDKSNVKQKWYDYTGQPVYLCPLSNFEFGKEVCVVRRLMHMSISKSLNTGIYGGNNSGIGAIMLAIALGFKFIFLLGIDMRIVNKTHHHSGYPNQSVDRLKSKLDKYISMFNEIAPMIKDAGIRVINLNKESALKCFDFTDIKEVI